MGFDKPDLGFVVHFQRPGSVIAYYQQVGRAGARSTTPYGVLLSGREDDEITNHFIRDRLPRSKTTAPSCSRRSGDGVRRQALPHGSAVNEGRSTENLLRPSSR